MAADVSGSAGDQYLIVFHSVLGLFELL